MSTYLCYDLRAIQSFIFRVPKLRYIIGGSGIVDRFDREIAPALGKAVFCAGGKGTFICESGAEADAVESRLVLSAHEFGLDIRLGRSTDFSEAAHCAERLYSFVPDKHSLHGHPCDISGLYPAGDGAASRTHAVVQKRLFACGEKMYRYFEERLLDSGLNLGPGLLGLEPVFLGNVDPDDEAGAGEAGFNSLDQRHRWAVICMDGNDMGSQFAHQFDPSSGRDHLLLQKWVGLMSRSLDECSNQATRSAIETVIRNWSAQDPSGRQFERCIVRDHSRSPQVVLPIRPLVVGGDDIVVLCHPRYALAFVKKAIEVWEAQSIELAKRAEAELGGLPLQAHFV